MVISINWVDPQYVDKIADWGERVEPWILQVDVKANITC